MSIVQSGSEIGLTNVTSDAIRSVESHSSGNASTQALAEKQLNAARLEEQQGVKENQPQSNTVQEPLSSEQLEKVAQQLQDFVGEMNRGLEFLVDKDSGRDVIKVIDKNSGDLVKQFPSEEVLTLVAKLSEMVGGLVDAKV
jgi:flagellar protein FlaG